MNYFLADDIATVNAGTHLAQALLPCRENFSAAQAMVVYLQGHLGAGKTTFSRGVLQALGHRGNVKSPTYTLVEPYDLNFGSVYHFDLYRLKDPQELEFLGAEEYFQQGLLCLVEWPEQGEGYIPAADLIVRLAVRDQGRQLELEGLTEKGRNLEQAFHLVTNLAVNLTTKA